MRGCELLENAATSKIADCSKLDFAQPTDSKEPVVEAKGRKAKLNRRLNRDVAKAVANGLDWLVQHQAHDGRWSSANFEGECDCTGAGSQQNDIGTTGLAILALQNRAGPTGSDAVNAEIERGSRG